MSTPNSITIVKPGSMGDVIHALPVVAAIHAHAPECHISWVVDSRWASLLENNLAISQTIIFPRTDFAGWRIAKFPAWLRTLAAHHSDTVIDLQGLLRSALISRAMKPQRIIGLDDSREGSRFFYDVRVPTKPRKHSVRRYLGCLDALGIPQPETPEFPLQQGQLPSVPSLDKNFILVHPFSRGAGKSLTMETLTHLCRSMSSQQVVLVGGAAPFPIDKNFPALNLLGRTSLSELLWLIRNASWLVSVDSGPAHIAAAVGTPLVAIHTWSDPRLVGPYSQKAWVWQGGKLRKQNFGDFEMLPQCSPDICAMEQIASLCQQH